ncbi:hypothetical protein [uncultured Dokdonia sp.]|uniref:hypothetical protein n=1 Tax=uncultured Dokdonia sp. TaxID=575653 RepID=UPI00262EA1D8|nr:hypothetical protein [uncultured Dokdonia sp.]
MTISKSLFTILCICLLLSCNSSNDDVDPTGEEMEMEIEEEIDENNNSNPGLVRSIDDGFKITYEYDGDRLIKASGNDSDRNLNITYTYNNDGAIMYKGIYEFEEPGSSLDIQFSYVYDSDGRLIEFGHNQGEYALATYQGNQVIADFGSSVQVIVDVDELGRVIRLETSYFYKIFTYDSNGDLILNEEYDSDTDELTKTYEYTYDTNANPFFNQLESIYLSDFIFTFWGSGWSFSDSIYYDFPYLPNNLTSITFTDQQSSTSTFVYTYNSEGQIVTAEENDLSDGSTENYTLTYY